MSSTLPYSLFKHSMVPQRADLRKGYFGAVVWCHFVAVRGEVACSDKRGYFPLSTGKGVTGAACGHLPGQEKAIVAINH